ncbi:hypothetical protein DW355_11965 [Hylemonella gracilis]|uniref:Uncharacterized protein n=1 Tax=Hylemonella gracilis TaxID=80880 RepID=A0A4P6ULE6_9BURK|nr:DUF4286 family protein [Hylemonella gracilis]QBK05364.1 hypothetical protein DW355_11965 [Hylemonella gracilis]
MVGEPQTQAKTQAAISAEIRATAVLALWNDVDPIHDTDYNDWHANEHVPERLTVPGMLWGLRFLASAGGTAGPRYLTLYGLRDVQVLDSAAYQHLLAWPTPMSARMRRVMHGISRAVYDVVAVQGSLAAPGLLLSEDTGEEGAPGVDADVLGLLRGQRRPDTQPLPWLRTGQTGFEPPASLRLLALARLPAPVPAQGAPATPGANLYRYRRLSVAGDGQV